MAEVTISSGFVFDDVKDILRRVTDNGVCADDARVMQWTNEAQMECLFARDTQTGLTVIPVGCMATYDMAADDASNIFLPKEIKNIIEIEAIPDPTFFSGGAKSVNGQFDVTQGWYDLVNPFAYVDPNLAHDNPLVDLGLFPDPTSRSIRRRMYHYPGLEPNSRVRVTGAKAYVPITTGADYLIVQNIPALKLMMLAIYNRENNNPDGSKLYKEMAVTMLIDEIKSFQLDPRQTLKRKAAYEADMANLPSDSFGYFLARLAFELPAGLQLGKSELKRLLEMSEQRLMAKGHPVGTIEEFQAEVDAGRILAPVNVKTILAADLDGRPLDIRNIFFQYLNNGPGRECAEMLIDEGEHYDAKTKKRYRQYRLGGSMTQYIIKTVAIPGPPGPPGPPGIGIQGPPGADGAPGGGGGSLSSLSLASLTGGTPTNLDGVDVDALGIPVDATVLVTIDGNTRIYQLQAGAPVNDVDTDDVAVLNHVDMRWRRTGA